MIGSMRIFVSQKVMITFLIVICSAAAIHLCVMFIHSTLQFRAEESGVSFTQTLKPSVGIGVVSEENIEHAIREGYRLFDSAETYVGHHKRLGRAIMKSGVPRSDFFLISKLGIEHLVESASQSDTALSCQFSLSKILNDLQTSYLDLLLIHWPGKSKKCKCKKMGNVNVRKCNAKCRKISSSEWPRRREWLWSAMEKEVEKGRVKFLGISNFNSEQISHLFSIAKIFPAFNQIERHPLWHDENLARFCMRKNITIMAYRPLSANKFTTFREDNRIKNMCLKYGKTLSQLAIRWSIQTGVTVVTSSKSKDHIRENLEVFDFIITKDDMEYLNRLPQIGRTNDHGQDEVN